jgi:1-acyl-sn-glycerol-3-phosphate acyltransferase
MGTYVVFTKLTPQGNKNLKANPNRLREVTQQAERLGVKVRQQYATLGPHDFVTVIEAEDNVAVQRVSAELARLGTIRSSTFPAIKMDRFKELLKIQPYRTEPHAWQTSFWASAVRRIGRPWTTTRYVKQYLKPFTVEGRENLKDFKGGAVVIANHSSHLDSPTVYMALPSRIANRLAMAAAADKFYPHRKKRVWWPSLFQNAFPVHRGGGTKQLEYPLSLLKDGWSILIYPEGGRSKSGQIARFKAGPAIMAMQAKAPVIPVYMEGLRAIMPKGNKYPTPGPVTARIGKPIYVHLEAQSVSDAVVLMENAMRELAGQAPHRAPAPAAQGVPAQAQASGGGGAGA